RAEDGIRDFNVTGVQTCALPISSLVVLVAAGFTWRTVLAEREARLQAETSDRVAEFLASIFTASDSSSNDAARHDLSAREVLARSEERRVGKSGGLAGRAGLLEE